MKQFGKFFVIAGAVLLAACSGAQSSSEVEALNKTQAIGSPFTKYLAAEYRTYANQEQYEMLDYPDALHFARKGLAAAAGEVVFPEHLDDWDLDNAHLIELGEARDMLVIVLENGARELAAGKAATAQARFDCWVEQQEEDWNNTGIPCKNEFYALLSELQALVKPAPEPVVEEIVLPEPVAEVVEPEPVKLEEALFIVFFDWDKSELSGNATEVVDAVVSEISKRGDVSKIVITGHTDSSGASAYNQKLSTRRAETVRTALINKGIDGNLIQVNSRGETDLLVVTEDNVREPANRRVQISLE